MAIVTYILHKDEPLTPEEEAELEVLKGMSDEDIIVDEDCPEFSDEQWAFYDYLMKKYKTNNVTKEMVLNELRENGDKWNFN